MKNRLPTMRQISAGVIVTNSSSGQLKVLLLEQNNLHYKRSGRQASRKIIDIGPSGKVEGGESLIEAAKRELKQETNLDLKIQSGFRESYNYHFDTIANNGKYKGKRVRIFKTRVYFLASVSDEELKEIKLSDEHVMYEFMTLEEAINSKSLMRPQKELLKKLEARPARQLSQL